MCGGNRLVLVQEVMEKEKKTKIRSPLHLHSAAASIPVKMFFSEFSYPGAVDQLSVSCDKLLFFIVFHSKNLTKKLSKECFELSVNKNISGYFENLDRGGFTYPPGKLVHTFQTSMPFFSFWCL